MKKLIALLLALVMVLSLAACGGKTEAPAADAPAADAPAAEPVEVDELSDTVRGAGGFGSTGTK